MARSTDLAPPSCESLADDLEWYLDDRDGSDGTDEGLPPLPAERRRVLEEHLERCPACARQLTLADRLRSQLRDLPAVLPREIPGEAPRVTPPPSAASESVAAWRRTTPWAATALGALVALALTVFLVQPLLTPEPPEPTPQELAQAEAEARYALAQLAEVTRRVGRHLRKDVLVERVMEPTTRHLRQSLAAPGTLSSSDDPSSNSTTPELPREPGR